MNVWKQLDQLYAQFKEELARTKEQARLLRARSVRVDDNGRWRASCRPRGGSQWVPVKAVTSKALVRELRRLTRRRRA